MVYFRHLNNLLKVSTAVWLDQRTYDIRTFTMYIDHGTCAIPLITGKYNGIYYKYKILLL